jgi:mycoredoxin
MPDKALTVYATQFCSDCAGSKRFLDRHSIPYRWVDIALDDDAAYVTRINKGMRSVPTIVFPDGAVLVEPTDAELAVAIVKHL